MPTPPPSRSSSTARPTPPRRVTTTCAPSCSTGRSPEPSQTDGLLIGLTIPPQSDTYWNGEAGPGDSYSDPGSGGPENDWTTRNTVFMTWNILHCARMLKDAGGVPTYGNSTHDWDLSHRDHPNPEYR